MLPGMITSSFVTHATGVQERLAARADRAAAALHRAEAALEARSTEASQLRHQLGSLQDDHASLSAASEQAAAQSRGLNK